MLEMAQEASRLGLKASPADATTGNTCSPLPVQVAGVETTILTLQILHGVGQVARLLADLLLTGLPAHPKVLQVGQSKAPHLPPRVAIGPDDP